MKGVYQMERAEYDAIQATNFSKLKNMARSPAHYRHGLVAPDVDTRPKRRGRVSHLAIYEPELFAQAVAVWPHRKQGKVWDVFAEAHANQEIMTTAEHEQCLAIAAAVRSHVSAGPYVAGGRAEATVLWTHTVPGIGALPGYAIECKARLDFLSNVGAIVDLKTTRDASPGGFGRQVHAYRYYMQAAFYVDGYAAATGRTLPYVLVAVEAAPPHVVQVYRVTEDVLEFGRAEYRALLERLHACREDNVWPGYGEGEMDLELPRWAIPRADDEDLTGLGLNFGSDAEVSDGT